MPQPSDPKACIGRALVTGGAGFIGSHIVEQLLATGCPEVVVIDNMVRGRRENLEAVDGSRRLRLVIGDIRDKELMAGLVAGCDVVFHQAALRITQCAAEPDNAREVMIDATHELFRQCVDAKVRKVVYASSASIYGLAESFPTSEDHHPYGNRTLYGAAKSFGEGILRTFNEMYGLNYVALRYFNAYGPRMDIYGKYTEVLIRWMERVERGEPPLIFGDGLQTMDFIHVEDIARANILAALSTATDVALNVGSGEETSLAELARLLTLAMRRPDLHPRHEAERSVNPVSRRLADVSRARALIGFEAKVPLREGLESLLGWWRAQSAAPTPSLYAPVHPHDARVAS